VTIPLAPFQTEYNPKLRRVDEARSGQAVVMLRGRGVEGMNPDQVHAARSPDLEVFATGGYNFAMLQAAVMGGGERADAAWIQALYSNLS
jgi:hypothetical protein